MTDIEVPDPVSQVKAPVDAVASEVKPAPRGSVRDTIAAIDAELARHAPLAPVAFSDPEI